MLSFLQYIIIFTILVFVIIHYLIPPKKEIERENNLKTESALHDTESSTIDYSYFEQDLKFNQEDIPLY